MNKILILICLMLTVYTSSVFGQTAFSASAKSRATGGEFTSDSDKVSAKDIFDINRTFFSTGYMPSLTSAGIYDGEAGVGVNAGTMNAFWAMPINKTMTVGFAGEYKMYSTKTDSWTTAAEDRTETYNENSTFNLRPVFMWNNFGFHYRISRGVGATTRTVQTTTTGYDYEKVFDEAEWQHEIGFAYKAKTFTVYVPVGVIIDNNYTTVKSTNTSTSEIVNSTTQSSAGFVAMYINPEFTMPLKRGPMTEFTVGLDAKFDVYNSGKYTGGTYTNVTSGTTTSLTVEYEDQVAVDFNAHFTPKFEWVISKGKIDFAVEPTVGLMYAHTNLGTYSSTENGVVSPNENVKSYANYAIPYLDVAVASLIRPVAWFEIRAGINYGIYWQNTIITTGYTIKDGGYDEQHYDFHSVFNAYTGFGFIFGTDFFIDIYIQAGRSSEGLANGYTSSSSYTSELFHINSYGAQISYRFK